MKNTERYEEVTCMNCNGVGTKFERRLHNYRETVAKVVCPSCLGEKKRMVKITKKPKR